MAYTLTGSYLYGDGSPRTGRLKFEPTTTVVGADSIILPSPLTVELVNGAFSVSLAATDDPAYSPSGWLWTVTESMDGGRAPWSFEFTADADIAELTATVDPADYSLTVPATRTITAGPGLTGGGDLSTDRTIAVGAGTGITVNADDVAVDTSVVATKASIGGLVAPPLAGVTLTARGTTPIAVDVWSGYTWGVYGTGIYRSADEGETWTLYATAAGSDVLRLLPTSDDEVIAVRPTQVHKSSGWAGGSPTWTLKATANGTSTYLEWAFDSDTTGTRFILTEYSSADRADSRYVLMSTDSGATFSTVYDSVAVHGATLADASHLHGAAYDEWGDRWYFVEGHDDGGTSGDIAGIYCSTDDGATWARADGMAQDPAPTAIVATRLGLVCGSDNVANGLYGVARRDDPADEQLVRTWAWNTGRVGLVGFARRGYLQPNTDTVFFGFATGYADVPPIIAAGTVGGGSLVYTWGDTYAANDFIGQVVMPSAQRLLAYAYQSGALSVVKAHAGLPGASVPLDLGNVTGGVSGSGDSAAIGVGAVAGTGIRNTAVGANADTTGSVQDAVAIGYSATAGQDAVAIGSNVTAPTGGCVVIGRSATTNGFAQGTVVGYNAKTTSAASVAVGWGASAVSAGTGVGTSATGGSGVAVGNSATVGATTGVALGRATNATGGTAAIGFNVTATHSQSLALGTSTTATSQVQVGARHIELTELASDAAAPAANAARLYTRDNGSGKTQLVVRFASGAIQVLATEP